jgi:predicted transcriptional regulator
MKSKIIELTDSKNQVMIDIVYTISQSERWYTLKEVADAINLSDRSSQRYVNHLYETVMAYNDEKEEHFSLLMKKNYGIKLLISSQANVEFLVNYILQEDENVKLLIALLFQDYESMTNYIELNCLAKYHVDQACSKCNDLLSVFSLEIEKKEFRINGKESNIRIFMHNFCWTLYKCEVWPDKFNFIDYHVIESDIIHITESLNIPITNPIKLKNITYRLTISLIRYYKKKPVVLSNKLKEAVPTYVNESDSLVLTEIVEQVFNKH